MKSKTLILLLLLSMIITGCSLFKTQRLKTCVEISIYNDGFLISHYKGNCNVEINSINDNNVIINCNDPLLYKDIEVNDSIEIIINSSNKCNNKEEQ